MKFETPMEREAWELGIQLEGAFTWAYFVEVEVIDKNGWRFDVQHAAPQGVNVEYEMRREVDEYLRWGWESPGAVDLPSTSAGSRFEFERVEKEIHLRAITEGRYMQPKELAAECRRVIEYKPRIGQPMVQLVLPREPSGQRIRLAGRDGGPLGEVCCVNSQGETVAAFNAYRVLDWMLRKGMIETADTMIQMDGVREGRPERERQ